MQKKYRALRTTSHWGAYTVEKHDDCISTLHPTSDDPDPSPISEGMLAAIDGPTRIRAPMIREGWLRNEIGKSGDGRGKESFVEVSWPNAYRLVSQELKRVIREHDNEAIHAGSYGWASAGRFHHAQRQLKRFLNCIGGFTYSIGGYSFRAAQTIVPHVLGTFHGHLDTMTG
ncbi:molybdopterin-dependent oxidoreductase [Lentibacter algarum]|uniref:molybdopterin-dependent oxidoreductase n=1 Tax=Lentibacter algarum TaxID=576131 RepID=UPI001C08406B|nr:molybdopterin-dependent oxidoreductase [Lentibacter algarum]MBU2983666.1 molybdopterin-dependent oxidoreductase [Lentibacter algarum]